MTGYESKKKAAQDKLDNDDLTIAYQSGYYDGKKAAQRPWVGLTKEDMPDGENPMFDHEYFIKGMVFASTILKEKNNAT